MRLPSYEVREGDAVEVLRDLPAGVAQTCVTSPPYFGLRDYGEDGQIGLEATVGDYVARLCDVFAEVHRTLRDDGTLWLNLGDSYATRWASTRDVGGKGLNGGSRSRTGQTRDGYKEKDMMGVPWRVAFALQDAGWWLRKSIVWCLSGGTRVYARTGRGDRPMMIKDLVRLDPRTVKLWNGEKWTQVSGWSLSPAPRQGALEIALRSGERIGCTAGHEWPTQRGNVQAADLRSGDVIQTCRLPEPDRVYAPHYIDQEVAWLIGLYLAEGSRDSRGRVQLAGHAKENTSREQRLWPIVSGFGGTLAAHSRGNQGVLVVDCPPLGAVIDQYIYGRTAKVKGIRPRAWKHSNGWLRALLDGYLAGDGHYDEAQDRWRLGFTRNDRLAGNLRTITARLGYPLTLKATHGEGFGKRWPIYRGEIRTEASTHWNTKSRSEVVRIERSRGRQFWDIGVEDEPHLFALASGVLTHNSKPNPTPESVRDRPTSSHELIFLLTKAPAYFYDTLGYREPTTSTRGSGNGYANPERVRPAGRARRNYPERTWHLADERNARDVWTIPTVPFPGAHFAVFPPELPRRCILLGSSPRACPDCGAPHRRRIERRRLLDGEPVTGDWNAGDGTGRRLGAQGVGHWRFKTETRTLGWIPTCACNAPPTVRSGDLDDIISPANDESDPDPSLEVGRAGLARPRTGESGSRSMTRWEQRHLAVQLAASPHRAAMTAEAGAEAFAHYIRTDRGGARLPRESCLASWRARGWVEAVPPVPPPWWTPDDAGRSVVLDPFAGAGTTGVVAVDNGRDFLGVELSPKYAAMARHRIHEVAAAPRLELA